MFQDQLTLCFVGTKKSYSFSYVQVFGVALVIRVLLLLYGEWHDRHLTVKYTDIDYYVYTDAARYITEGQSPYLRATYRYTPLLALLLTPNVYAIWFGKVLFAVADLLAGCATHSLLRSRTSTPLKYTCLWLFNPLVFNMSSRGSADVLLMALLLGTLWCVEQNRLTLGAVLYGLCVHLRIYPVIYGPAFVLFLSLGSSDKADQTVRDQTKRKTVDREIDTGESKREEEVNKQVRRRKLSAPTSTAACNNTTNSEIETNTRISLLNTPFLASLTNTLTRCFTFRSLWFFSISASTFFVFAGIFYVMYGYEFLEETYFYHFGRKDNRHNFSLYFYHLYLRYSSPSFSTLAFLPQLLLTAVFTCKFYRDIAFCVFLQTYCFVVFNKVCTAQYFLWYIGLLPLILPRVSLSHSQAAALVACWVMGETHWLFWAYRLEFLGQNTFRQVWIASAIFFVVNVGILVIVISFYRQKNAGLSAVKT